MGRVQLTCAFCCIRGVRYSRSAVEKSEFLRWQVDINDGVKAKFIYNLLSLSETAGEKVLVFSQYVRSLNFLGTLFTKMKGWKAGVNTFLMDGGLTQEQREQAVERFNSSPEAKVFFGSIKACGEGISLVGASRVVILDVHENPAVMRQAIGRAFRPGQSKMVYCYRLVAAGSPEEEDHHTAFKKERVSKLWYAARRIHGNPREQPHDNPRHGGLGWAGDNLIWNGVGVE